MKLLIKLLVIILVVSLILLYGLAFLLINTNGKAIIEAKLKDTFKAESKVGKVRVGFPFDVFVYDIEVKDVFKIKQVYARLGMIDLLGRDFILPQLNIKGAQIYLHSWDTAQTPPEAAEESASGLPEIKKPAANSSYIEIPFITIKHLAVTGSELTFLDDSNKDRPLKIYLKDLDIKVDNLKLPLDSSEITRFDISARLPWESSKDQGKIRLKGWIDLFKKDMQASLKIKDIDGLYFYPYYSKWVDLENSRIESAKLNFTSQISGLNNDVTADCHLELTQVAFKPRQEEEHQEKAEKIALAVIDLLKALNEGNIVLDFKFKTKMDSPDFALAPIIKLAVESKIKQARNQKSSGGVIVNLPGRIIGGTVTTLSDVTKSVVNGTVTAGKELGGAVGAAFKKDTEESDPKK